MAIFVPAKTTTMKNGI